MASELLIGLMIEYFMISVFGTVIGAVAGVLVGKPVILVIKYLKLKLPDKAHYLIPWRTVLAGLLLINVYNYYPIWYFGIGWKTGLVDIIYFVSISVIALIIQFTYFIGSRHFTSRISISFIRSLFVLMPLVFTHYSRFSVGGLGKYFYDTFATLQYGRTVVAGLLILAVILLFDLFSGAAVSIYEYYAAKQSDGVPTNRKE